MIYDNLLGEFMNNGPHRLWGRGLCLQYLG